MQMKDTRTTPAFSTKSGRYGDNGSDSSETSSKGSPNLIPKEEGDYQLVYDHIQIGLNWYETIWEIVVSQH